MKKLALAITAALAFSAAQASDLVQLTQPTLSGVGIAGRTACVGSAFNSDNSVVGACRTVTASACSGRGCQPVTYTTTYVANWDALGEPTGTAACSLTRHHLPQADQVTFLNGYTSCPSVVFDPTQTVVVIGGFPMYYVTTDAATGAELVNNNVAGYLYLP